MKLDLTVIISCRDEWKIIREVVYDIGNVFFQNNIPGNVIVVDDNSTPPLTLEDIELPHCIKITRLYKNVFDPGLAEALKTGITYAHSRYVIFMSGDGTDDPESIPLYYHYLLYGCDCVFGQRKWPREYFGNYPTFKKMLKWLGNRLISRFFDKGYSDYTGMFKGYRLSTAHLGLNCHAKGFAFPMELCLKAIMSGASYKVL